MEPHPSDGDVPPKSTLFCPDCGHRSRPGGDWRIVETATATRYACPDCDAEVAVRPSIQPDRPPVLRWSPTASLRLWTGFWSRVVNWW